jgi:hypothetical protein
MDATVLGYIAQSPVSLVNLTSTGGDITTTTTALATPNENFIAPAVFPPDPIIPPNPILDRPFVPGLFIALIPPNPI